MKLRDVVKEINVEERERNKREIPPESVELLEVMGIPREEWEYMVGVATDIPSRYRRLREELIKKGLEIEEKREDGVSRLVINFPEGLRLEEPLFLSCLSHSFFNTRKKLLIKFSRGSAGKVVHGSPIPKLFERNVVRNDIELVLEDGADGEVAFLLGYDLETYVDSGISVKVGKDASLKLSGVIFNPGRQLGLRWNFELEENSRLFFDEVNFLMDAGNYRGSWSDVNILGKNVKCEINSADFAFAAGESKAVYIASIKEGGKKAEVEINSYSMDFSRGARKVFMPGFYTREDEVVLKHSAGSARFGEDKVEYMRSRGLSGKEISYLIIDTILEKTVYDKLPSEFVDEMSRYTRYIIRKMEVII